jgi:hypothetical protein
MSAKYEYRRSVTHRCGHSQSHTLHARCRQEADSWAFNLKKVECDECREKTVRIAAEAKAVDLPTLLGTPNQVTWANAIRQRIYNMLSRTDRYHHAVACCRYETQATWWIENRNAATPIIVAHLTDSGRRAA